MPCHTRHLQPERRYHLPGASICTSLSIGPNDTLTLNPGIYYFNNADLAVRGRINGDGVTLVFTGNPDQVGTIQINSQATGSLRAPPLR